MTPSSDRLDKHLVSLTAPSSFAAEQYQGLRLTLERLKRSRDVRVMAVTSPAAGDGKTLTSINLAASLARGSDARVLLIDADLRRPAVASRLGMTDEEGPGLANVLAAEKDMPLGSITQMIEPFNLTVVPAGSHQTPVHELLRSSRFETLITEARERFDFVVLDTPPLLPVFDAAVLSKVVDGFLVVVAANQTPRKLLGEALNLLDASKVLGIVFNGDERPLFGYYKGYYRRYYRQYFGAASGVASEA